MAAYIPERLSTDTSYVYEPSALPHSDEKVWPNPYHLFLASFTFNGEPRRSKQRPPARDRAELRHRRTALAKQHRKIIADVHRRKREAAERAAQC